MRQPSSPLPGNSRRGSFQDDFKMGFEGIDRLSHIREVGLSKFICSLTSGCLYSNEVMRGLEPYTGCQCLLCEQPSLSFWGPGTQSIARRSLCIQTGGSMGPVALLCFHWTPSASGQSA
eukprot:scaffold322_cov475-Prasinococcus_capsulatus_cf.AAC.2